MNDIPTHLVDYFSAELLALYQNQPDRYAIKTDYFSGEIETSGDHYEQFAAQSQQHLIDVRFGFRTLQNADLALAVFMPDLLKASPDERAKWSGFHINQELLSPEPDARFDMWVKRYLDGSWDIDNGAVAQLKQEVKELNALAACAVGESLFNSESSSTLQFPTAQNNHRYHDAHSEAYKLLIDGLNKNALNLLASKLGIVLTNPGSDRTLKMLARLIPESLRESVLSPFEVTSSNRRLADHQQRPSAAPMKAFERFNEDMTEIVKALRLLKQYLSKGLDITIESAVKRSDALSSSFYPTFDDQLEIKPNYSICKIAEIEGKTITRVEYGCRKQHPGAHNSELIVLYFADGSQMAIHTGSNAGNLTSVHENFEPEHLRISFALNYVPPTKSHKTSGS